VPRPLPAILFPHGGPWARDTWGFHNVVQFLANRGYAVLQPNFRGSTGFGKRFLNLGNREWGTGAMQHDLTDGVRWLIEQGIADPGRIAIMGGSYGGYAALAGVAFTPDLYAAAVSIVGPSSIPTLLDSIPPYWEPVRRTFHVRVGDPEDPADLARMRAQSPLYAAERIRTPLLVVQGANDPRVKKPESDQIVRALRDLGREVEYLVAADEGHGFASEESNQALFARIEEFLARHLGGRYQADMSERVRRRLAELTVAIEEV
jgi:dipeptidyl aminopeptidase/acylaminoacyl peptidase